MHIGTCFAIGIVASAAVLMMGCSDSDGPRRADLRVVHASPNAPAVDVRIDGEGVLSAVPYKVASDFLSARAGEREVEVLVAGTETVVISATLELAPKSATTVIAADFVASIQPIVLADDRSAPPAGQAKVRIVHGAPSAPAVDIYVTVPNAALGVPTLTNVPFLAESGYLTLPAGTYQARVAVAGTQAIVIDTGAVPILAGAVVTAIAVDAPGGGAPFDLLLLDDSE